MKKNERVRLPIALMVLIWLVLIWAAMFFIGAVVTVLEARGGR